MLKATNRTAVVLSHKFIIPYNSFGIFRIMLLLLCVSQLSSFIHEWQEVGNRAECGLSPQWKTHFFQPACMQIDKHQKKTTTKVNGERRLCFVGTGETMACVVVIMKQRLPFQQLPLLRFFNNVALYILWIYLILEGIEPKETAQFNLMCKAKLLRACMCTAHVCECECMFTRSMIHLWWIKPAVSIEWWPGTPRTQGNDGVRDR